MPDESSRDCKEVLLPVLWGEDALPGANTAAVSTAAAIKLPERRRVGSTSPLSQQAPTVHIGRLGAARPYCPGRSLWSEHGYQAVFCSRGLVVVAHLLHARNRPVGCLDTSQFLPADWAAHRQG